jgi:hypothetical protein
MADGPVSPQDGAAQDRGSRPGRADQGVGGIQQDVGADESSGRGREGPGDDEERIRAGVSEEDAAQLLMVWNRRRRGFASVPEFRCKVAHGNPIRSIAERYALKPLS